MTETTLPFTTEAGPPATETQAATPRAGTPNATLAVAALGGFIIILDALVVNVALPSIGRDLGGSITGLQWVIDAYTLMFAALLLSAGTLADRLGASRSFGIGLVLFVVASAACGFATNMETLIVARLVQGAGAAAMMPASLAMLREGFPNARARSRAIAIWAMAGAIASAAGPLVGGILTEISWRAIFFINLPVGVVALFLLTRVAPSPRRPVPFDWIGQISAVVGLGALTYGLIEGGAIGLTAPETVISLSIAIVALGIFFASQHWGSHPMLSLPLLRSRPVAVSMFGGFAFTVGFYGLVFLLSIYLQQERGLSPLQTGLAFVPITALSAFVNLLTPRMNVRYGPRIPLALGQLLIALGLLSLCLLLTSAPIWLLALVTMPVGIGGALAMPTVTGLMLNSVPAERAGMAGGALNTFRQVGGAVAIAVFGALVGQQAGFVHGMRLSLIIAGVLLLATAAMSFLLAPGRESIDWNDDIHLEEAMA